MTIKTPRMHVAESTVNRILNVADGLRDTVVRQPSLPDMPDVGAQGEALDNALATPQGTDVTLPPGGAQAIPQAVVEGEELIPAITDASG